MDINLGAYLLLTFLAVGWAVAIVQCNKKSNLDFPIAVTAESASMYGCPRCGYCAGHTKIAGMGACVIGCGECGYTFIMLSAGITKSPFGIGDEFPQLSPHPRAGILAHGTSRP